MPSPNTLIKPPAVLIIGPKGAGKSELARDLVDLTGWQLYNRAQISRQFMFDNNLDRITGKRDEDAYNARLVGERVRLLATGLPLIFNGQGYTKWSATRSQIVAAKYVPFVISLDLLPEYVETLATASSETHEDIEASYYDYKCFANNKRNRRDIRLEIDKDNDPERLQIAVNGLQAYINAYPNVEKLPNIE